MKNKYYKLFVLKDKAFLIVIVLLCLLIASFLGHKIPRTIQQLFKNFDQSELFFAQLWILGSIFVGEYLNRVVYQLSINKYVQHLILKVRQTTYGAWISSFESKKGKGDQEEEYPLGEVLARIMSDTEAIRELINSGSFAIFIDLFFVLSCFISFIGLNSTTGTFLMVVEIMACLLLYIGSRKMAQIFLEVRKENANVSRTFSDLTAGLKQAYFFKHQNYLSRKAEVSSDNFLRIQLKANIWDASYYSLAESLFPLLLVLFAFIFPYSKITELALVVAIIDLIQRSINPIKDVAGKMSNFQRAGTGISRIRQFLFDLDEEGMVDRSQQSAKKLDICEMNVTIKKFSYPSRDNQRSFSLDDIEFKCRVGELIGVVGKSGSGKSTLLQLLTGNLGLSDPDSSIELVCGNGQKFRLYKDVPKEEFLQYRFQVGIISQESHIFTGSLRFNIGLSQNSVKGIEEFWEEVRNQIPYVKEWGIKLDDTIKPDSVSLGQKQLIAALRACYLKKPVVFFDEISSALDSDLEYAIRGMISLVQKNAMTFIVAHRLETLLESDSLLVVENGKLIDQGKHADLSQRCEVYQSFMEEISK